MKTLIIHPEDSSTDFLKTIYEDIEDKTVIDGGITKDEVKALIENHDRVMMMGHGGPSGLFGCKKFKGNDWLIIDRTMVESLREKDNSVFIWCHASDFVDKHELMGFYSGMFISETIEAMVCGVNHVLQWMVDESNNEFCNILAESLDDSQEDMFDHVVTEYGKLAEVNPVAHYNHERLRFSKHGPPCTGFRWKATPNPVKEPEVIDSYLDPVEDWSFGEAFDFSRWML